MRRRTGGTKLTYFKVHVILLNT